MRLTNKKLPFFERLSISKRMAIGYSLGLFVMLSVFGFFIYQVFHQAIHNNYDRHLSFEATQLAPYIELADQNRDSLTVEMEANSRNLALMRRDTNGTFVRVYNSENSLQYVSPNLKRRGNGYEARIPEETEMYSYSHEWQGLPARTMYHPLERDGRFIGWLEVTGFEWALHEQITTIINYQLLIILLSVLFSLLGGYLLSRRALSPITSINDTARNIHFRDLNQRLPVKEGVRDELTDLAETFNNMLDRLQRGFQREQQFTSDAAHELKTPISSLRTETDIVLRKERSPEEYQETLLRIREEVERMSDTVHLLLELSRLEGRERLSKQPLDLAELARQTAGRISERAQAKSVSLECCTNDRSVTINGHEGYLREAIENLLQNALKYTPSGGSITINAHPESGGNGAELIVEDTGIGFETGQGERLFDRFYRSNRQEVRKQSGSGLGLSLVKSIVEMHGGTVSAYSEGPGQGSRFTIHLPVNNR